MSLKLFAFFMLSVATVAFAQNCDCNGLKQCFEQQGQQRRQCESGCATSANVQNQAVLQCLQNKFNGGQRVKRQGWQQGGGQQGGGWGQQGGGQQGGGQQGWGGHEGGGHPEMPELEGFKQCTRSQCGGQGGGQGRQGFEQCFQQAGCDRNSAEQCRQQGGGRREGERHDDGGYCTCLKNAVGRQDVRCR